MGEQEPTGLRKVVAGFKRRSGQAVEEFNHYWSTQHADKVSRLPGLVRYVQNELHPSAYSRGREPYFDAIAETWFDSSALSSLRQTQQYRLVREDEASFIDPASVVELAVSDVVVVDGTPTDIKLMTFVHRRPDLSVPAFGEYWRDVHGPLAARDSRLRRYVQSHVVARAYASDRTPAFDGVGSVWFDDFETMRESAKTDEAGAAHADAVHFLVVGDDAPPTPTLVAGERVVVA
jgi:uncharacterized protein (TIGR02118 family)